MLIGKDVLIMEIYKRLLMTYIDKYKRLDLDMLTEEMRLTETQIVDIVYSLIEEGFVYMKDHKYKISEKGEYSYAAEPPVQFRLSHLSRRSEPL